MAFAGWITIGTRNDTSKFDKQMAQVEKKIRSAENKKMVIEAKLQGYDEEINKADKLIDKRNELNRQLIDLQQQYNTTGNRAELFPQITETKEQIAQTSAELNKSLIYLKRHQGSVLQLDNQWEEVNREIAESKANIESINLQRQQSEVQKLKGNFDNVGKSIQGSVKNVGRMIIRIFGIRSAYMALRSASSTLAQYDKTYAANLEYIRWALAQAVAPVLQKIVSLAATLLNYVYAILNAWFGLFKNVDLSVKAFKKMKAGAGGVAKAAKEIKKQLAGFDEMNVLQDTSSGGGGKAGGGTPNFDLGAMKGDPPKWLQWIIDNKDLILSVLAGIAAGLLALKLGATGLQSLGIGVAIAGVVYAIQSLIAYLKDPTWDNFGKIMIGIGVAIAGIGIATGNLIPVIVGVLVAIVGLVMKNWDKISAFLEKKLKAMQNKVQEVKDKWGEGIGSIYNEFVWTLNKIYEWFKTSFESYRLIFDGIIKFVKGIIEGDWTKAWEGARDIVTGVVTTIVNNFMVKWQIVVGLLGIIVGAFKHHFEQIGNFVVTINDKIKQGAINVFNSVTSKIVSMWDTFKNKASEAWASVKNVFSNVGNFFGGIWNTIKSKFTDIGQRVGNAIGGAFRNAINAVLSSAQRVINAPINTINRLINVINAVPGINLGRLSTISLPRLATGAIINMPNRGVNIGGAIAGESGREGILPLTDTRAMQMLGEEIGKWITINANITNTMNGRVISRELQKIQNEENFAYNS